MDQPLYETSMRPRVAVPRVSVGMPVYNAEKFLAAAIESVLGQTFGDLELIISDNASTDGSAVVCERYAARDSRVRLLRSSVNMGANPNYRKVAQTARGEYFKWASSNDLLAPDYIARCVRVLDERPDTVLAYGTTVLFEDDPREGTRYDDRMNLQDNHPFVRFRRCVEELRLNNVLNGVFRLSALRQTSMLPDYMSSDNVLIAELALAGKIVEVPETHFYRRMDRDSSTRLQSSEEVRRHHYPTDRISAFFQTWQLARGYWAVALFNELPLDPRLRTIAYVARRTYWLLPNLAADVREAFRFYVLRIRH